MLGRHRPWGLPTRRPRPRYPFRPFISGHFASRGARKEPLLDPLFASAANGDAYAIQNLRNDTALFNPYLNLLDTIVLQNVRRDLLRKRFQQQMFLCRSQILDFSA